jgi:hypothetical protein
MSDMAQDIRLMWPSIYNPITDTHVLTVGKGVNKKMYMFTSEEWNDYRYVNTSFKEKEVARHPKYSAEAARLKPPTKPDAYTWVDPRGLSYLDDAAARKAADAKIAKEYDDLFWSTVSPPTTWTAVKDSPALTGASPWDYVSHDWDKYSKEKGELPMNPFLDKVVKMEYVGSRITCNPAPTDTDEDVLLLTDDLEALIGDCIEVGFTRDGDTKASYPEGFVSLRSGSMNFIVTDDEEFYKKFMLATHVCKSLNVMEKSNRILVFQAILYDEAVPAANPVEDTPF